MFIRGALTAFLTVVVLFDSEVDAVCMAGNCPDVFDARYMTHEEIGFYLDGINGTPGITVSTIGQTALGTDIRMVNIDTKPANVKNSIYIQGGTYGNEWLSVATALNLVEKFKNNPRLSDELDINIVPVVNPDGYIYSQETNRTWQKNRAPISGTNPNNCVGVNLGRNWNVDWGVSNSSTDPCDRNFAGTAAFSELETFSIGREINNLNNLKLAIDIQGDGMRILYPYNFVKTSVDPPNNLTTNIRYANNITDETFLVNGNSYSVENGAAINVASGTASDWAKQSGVPYVYTIEVTTDDETNALRDSANINSTKEEIWAGLNPMFLMIIKMN